MMSQEVRDKSSNNRAIRERRSNKYDDHCKYLMNLASPFLRGGYSRLNRHEIRDVCASV